MQNELSSRAKDRQHLTQAIVESFDGPSVQRFHLMVAGGPAPAMTWASNGSRCSIGSHSANDVVLEDPTVSRFHCQLTVDALGVRLRDLGSRNGTKVDGTRVLDGYLRDGSLLQVGRSTVSFQLGTDRVRLPLSDRTVMGPLVGKSLAMRTVFALLQLAAKSEATVLLEGETGTGKEGAAQAIHRESSRRDGPFIVVDCGAIPGNLLESELFGHEKGAFTGACERRLGAFEEASTGTLFLDEVGELPIDLQPKLLRALESKEIRRVGSSQWRAADVRVVAATNRELRTDVNTGRFRSDLYYRLAVVTIALPPLRSRLEDLPLLVGRLLGTLGADTGTAALLSAPEFLRTLESAAWPGNVRELRNFLQRCLVFRQPIPTAQIAASISEVAGDIWHYVGARRRALDEFERRYLEALLARHDGKVALAAKEAGVGRVYLYKLLKRHAVGHAT
jgi:transcriptional regulator with PAS, ATPase and Fis domain